MWSMSAGMKEEVRGEKTQADTSWNARSHPRLSCARGLAGRPGGVGHHRYAIVWEQRLGAGVGVSARQSAFAVAEDDLVLEGCARVRFCGASRVT